LDRCGRSQQGNGGNSTEGNLIICTPGDKLECDRAMHVTRGGGAFRDGNSEVGIKNIGWEDLDSVNLVRCMNKWQAIVNTVINRRGS